MSAGSGVGIESLRVWPSTLAIDMTALVEARGGDVSDVVREMLIDERSVCPAWEDPVTLGVNAALDLLACVDREPIKLLLVASESGLDQEKSLSTWIHRFLELPDDCRNLEVKHACYGGTGCLQLASSWLLAQPPETKALVITTDQSRQHFHKPYEFVMGAGSVAMLLSRTPSFLDLDLGLSGVYTHEVSDLLRPTSRVEAGHSETSLLSYLDAADITFDRYRRAMESRTGRDVGTVDALREALPFQVYHAPFGGITARAHKAVLRTLAGFSPRGAAEDFNERIAPGLRFNRRMGGTYASSVFISLLGVVDAFGEQTVGRRVGIYSYGSGSCAEFYSGVFGEAAPAIARQAAVGRHLDGRRLLDVRGYEEAERERSCWVDCGDFLVSLDGHDRWYESRYAGRKLLTLVGAEDFVRSYRWA
jgi:hydroxymethylglutaryl-CoA synthase